jgi:hypothetical protein
LIRVVPSGVETYVAGVNQANANITEHMAGVRRAVQIQAAQGSGSNNTAISSAHQQLQNVVDQLNAHLTGHTQAHTAFHEDMTATDKRLAGQVEV